MTPIIKFSTVEDPIEYYHKHKKCTASNACKFAKVVSRRSDLCSSKPS